eukprot:SAG25_NODE_11240_length_310_cov_0.672986_1_plen_35_part_10
MKLDPCWASVAVRALATGSLALAAVPLLGSGPATT